MTTEAALPGPDWLIPTEKGFYCIPGKFYLDPFGGVETGIVSHCHADHFRPSVQNVIGTTETIALGKRRYNPNADKNWESKPLNEVFEVNGVKIKLSPSWHIPGSAMIHLEYKGETILYTGDFNSPLEGNWNMAELKPDLLISESTFGEKEKHSEPEDALKEIIEVSGRRPLLVGSYVIGKAQHLSHLIHQNHPEITVFAHSQIMMYNRIYEELGLPFGTPLPYRKRDVKRTSGKLVYLAPPRILTGYANDDRFFRVFASGWDKQQELPYLDSHFDFSDHADKTDILNLIEELQPANIWFFHGYSESLRKQMASFKIPSVHVNFVEN